MKREWLEENKWQVQGDDPLGSNIVYHCISKIKFGSHYSQTQTMVDIKPAQLAWFIHIVCFKTFLLKFNKFYCLFYFICLYFDCIF